MEEGQNDEGRLQLMLNSERIARPSMDDMRARVYEAATEASYACTHPNSANPTPTLPLAATAASYAVPPLHLP